MFWHLSNSLVRQSTGNRTYPISGNCGWIVLAFMSAESRRRYRISANEIPLRFLETGEQLCKGWARLLLTADLDRCRSLRIDGPNCEHCKLQNLVDCPVHLGWDYFRLVPLLFRGEHGSQDFLQRLHHSVHSGCWRGVPRRGPSGFRIASIGPFSRMMVSSSGNNS